MVELGKSFVKIGSCLQIDILFLFYRIFQPPIAYYDSAPLILFYLMFQPHAYKDPFPPPHLFGTQE